VSEATRPDAGQDPLLGTRVGEFVVQRKLAAGGMGAVYYLEHVHPRLKLKKVLKVLLPEFARHPQLRERFEREAEAAAKLKHENIVSIDNFGQLPDGQLFMTIPFLEGQPLDEYLAAHGGKLQLDDALHITFQLCDALDLAHREGVIHRDLKPSNVFVTPTAKDPLRVMLIDFGISKLAGPDAVQRTHSGMSIGTPGYMPCEQYDRPGDATHRADLFALAVMFTEMVTGLLPWGLSDPAVLYFMQRTQRPTCPPGMEAACFEHVIGPSLSFNPNERVSSAHEFALGIAIHTHERSRSGKTAMQLLREVQPRFVDAAPVDVTYRMPASVPSVEAMPFHAPQASYPSAAPVTANQRPGIVANPRTTLSSSSGSVGIPLASPRRSGWKLMLAGVGASAAAGAVTFAIVMGRSSSESVREPAVPAPSIGSAASSGTAPASRVDPKTSDSTARRSIAISAPVDAGATPSDAAAQGATPPPIPTEPGPPQRDAASATKAVSKTQHDVAKPAHTNASTRHVGPPHEQPPATPRPIDEPPSKSTKTERGPARPVETHSGSAHPQRGTFDPNAPAGDD